VEKKRSGATEMATRFPPGHRTDQAQATCGLTSHGSEKEVKKKGEGGRKGEHEEESKGNEYGSKEEKRRENGEYTIEKARTTS